MKNLILIGILIILTSVLKAQSGNDQAAQLSHKIAKKMRDSLDLSAQQRQQIYEVNMSLHEQKQLVRQQNPPADSLQPRIQRIEKSRDVRYRPILGEEKYQLYLQKKRNLVNNN